MALPPVQARTFQKALLKHQRTSLFRHVEQPFPANPSTPVQTPLVSVTQRSHRVLDVLDRPVAADSLIAFRIGFGLLMALAIARYFANGWITLQFGEPEFFFTYPGLDWIRPGPLWVMRAGYAALGVLALLIAAGFWLRPAALLFAAGFTYCHLCDKTNYLNHYYLVSLLAVLLAIAPLARRRDGRPHARRRIAFGYLLVFRFQVAAVYFFAGLAKLNADWLLRAQPLDTWLAERASMPLVGPLLAQGSTAYLFSWAGLAFDLTIPLLLLLPRTRAWAFALVVSFHAATAALFPIGLFPWVMTLSAMLLLPPDWPAGLARLRVARRHVTAVETTSASRMSRPLVGLLAVHLALQALLPLRYHWSEGNANWTEAGFRFAWKVMLIDKRGHVDFTAWAQRGENLERIEIDPARHLTPLQVQVMTRRPDMLLQFAHHLQDSGLLGEHDRVRVHAHTRVAFNGHPARAIVDPRLDLATIERTAALSTWVLPW